MKTVEIKSKGLARLTDKEAEILVRSGKAEYKPKSSIKIPQDGRRSAIFISEIEASKDKKLQKRLKLKKKQQN